MSEEFLRVAKKEISEDIAEIDNLLKNCTTDVDVAKNMLNIQKHVHKIKGLAPMMGQEEIGQIATLLDKILKTMQSDKPPLGIYSTIKQSYVFMKNAIDGDNKGYEDLYSEIKKNHADLL
ncbi:MAG: Hpt domain-containing protein [Candidatus Nitrosotenuis sp.]